MRALLLLLGRRTTRGSYQEVDRGTRLALDRAEHLFGPVDPQRHAAHTKVGADIVGGIQHSWIGRAAHAAGQVRRIMRDYEY